MKLMMLIVCVFLGFFANSTVIRILHTNDLHSHFLGFSPNRDYTPGSTFNDPTRGGMARLKTAIDRHRLPGKTLLLDGGDFLMGTLFHTITRETGAELITMNDLRFDATVVGNHEFDFGPHGFARSILSATKQGPLPLILSSNIRFSESDKDDELEALFGKHLFRTKMVEKDGVKIGLMGIMGVEAARVAKDKKPVEFDDPVETAQKFAKALRAEGADLVIALSHSGVSENPDLSEDEILAQKVPDIDVIVSGHSHTLLKEPIQHGNTLIIQAGSYSEHLGVLDLVIDKQRSGSKIKEHKYEVIEIDDRIPGDPEITRSIERFKQKVETEFLKPLNMSFDQVVVETSFDLPADFDESPIGNLVTDAYRWHIEKETGEAIDFAFAGSGLLREPIKQGQSGMIQVSDVFRLLPIGMDSQEKPGYPLVVCYLNAEEVQNILEVITTIVALKGKLYSMQTSGLQFSYNPYRLPFHRVTHLCQQKGEECVPLEKGKLYSITMNAYMASHVEFIEKSSFGILKFKPKDKDGNALSAMENAVIPGPIKEWEAVLRFMQSFADINGNGVPDIPTRYKDLGRQFRKPGVPYPLFLTLFVVGFLAIFGVWRYRKSQA